MKNSNDTIGNRTRDLPACSVVPQPTAPLRAPVIAHWPDKSILITEKVIVQTFGFGISFRRRRNRTQKYQ